jgi:hypothetical protein
MYVIKWQRWYCKYPVVLQNIKTCKWKWKVFTGNFMGSVYNKIKKSLIKNWIFIIFYLNEIYEAGGIETKSWCYGEERNLMSLLRLEHRFLGRPSHSLLVIPTEFLNLFNDTCNLLCSHPNDIDGKWTKLISDLIRPSDGTPFWFPQWQKCADYRNKAIHTRKRYKLFLITTLHILLSWY